ncbi:MAG: hypothetical protein LBS44_05810, partial [Deltaproteobacteria bacterium]|nr:hypothetical protein [Deltaproteobacteria bacterium]
TIPNLLVAHSSEPSNPLIANTFFLSGLIESWGRFLEKITEACKNAGKPAPLLEYKYGRELSVTFFL